MNKKIYFIPLLLLAVLFASCEETKEASEYDNWQIRNEAFIDSVRTDYDNGTTDKEGRKIERFALLTAPNKYMYFKRLTPVTNTPPVDPETGKIILGRENEYIEGYEYLKDTRPLYTDKVSLYYKGTLINRVWFDGFSGANPTIFDTTSLWEVNSSKIISGWPELLQQISVGERWEVYIPWDYAYGSSGSGSILGYSTLIFDIQLYGIE